ncbi:MAG: MoxR family ATPase [Pseudomonadota bacterium]
MQLNDFPLDNPMALSKAGSWPAAAHQGKARDFKAVVAAWHVGRPLLVRGEAGVGKSQLAHAVAHALQWQFVSINTQPQTDYSDLLWEFDAVARLATAQLLGAAGAGGSATALPPELAHERFLRPGPLWWAYRPGSAATLCTKAGTDTCPYLYPRNDKQRDAGLVLLIDEIDKADSRLPNGLLEILGNGDFTLPNDIDGQDEMPRKPLVLITSNNERQLPVAFMRRCLVLDMTLPEDDGLIDYLTSIGDANAKRKIGNASQVKKPVRRKAAEAIVNLRQQQSPAHKPPGVAEYLDLLNALGGIEFADGPDAAITELSELVLEKSL